MQNNISVEKGYEDAIPVKRSRKAERLRNEARREAESRNVGVDFVLNRKNDGQRNIPRKIEDKPTYNERAIVATVVKEPEKTNPAAPKKVAKPVRPPVKPRVLPEYEAPAIEIIEPVVSEVNQDAVTKASEVIAETETSVDAVLDEQAESVTDAVANDEDTSDSESLKEYVNISEVEKLVLAESDSSEDELSDEDGVKVGELATVSREREPSFIEKRVKSRRRIIAGRVIRRFFLSVFTLVMVASIALMGALYTVANGPSESVRNTLVLSALQASATKWVPGVFLDDAVVDGILEDSQKVNEDVISIEDYAEQQKEEGGETDKWANAIDGMLYESVKGPTFKGYVLLIKDPSRVSVAVANERFSDATIGMRIFEMADKYGAVAAINGGEYPDAGGMGSGGRPIGLTYSGGVCKWSDGLRRSFMGFDKDNRLVVCEGLTKAQADAIGIRDGVCFKTGKTLITNDNGQVTMYYADNDTGTAQRTAIGQTADGTVIFLVTDGRTASSLGATHNDVIDIMVSYGAISAGMLDGGSSSLMYYRDFYDKYGLDKSEIDEYQKMGLINRYAAFTNPRKIPTCFIVAPE